MLRVRPRSLSPYVRVSLVSPSWVLLLLLMVLLLSFLFSPLFLLFSFLPGLFA